MSGKAGRKPTGRKPEGVRRQNARADGAFGREAATRVTSGASSRNIDKASRKEREQVSAE
jgi:hypothetical protein